MEFLVDLADVATSVATNMAALRKKERSPYWFACFTLPDGRRVQRSTRETRRKEAQSKADQWELLAKERTKARQAHRVISDIYRAAHKEELPDSNVRNYVEGWLARRKGEVAPASYASYSGRCLHFLDWLEDFATRPLAELETRQFVLYRDAVAETRSATTANHAVKILRGVFESARRDGFIAENPAKDCGLLKKSNEVSRRPFTLSELRRVLAAASDEWRSMVLFSLYTGQRLGDVARLTWANIDLTAQEIHLMAEKVGRVTRIPIAAPLFAHIESLPAGDNPKQPIHPKAATLISVNGSTLSRQFGELLASLGLVSGRTRPVEENGRAVRRAKSELSFHSLRHTATSMMKNAGISPAIVQDIIGHDSAEMSAHYTHIETSAKRNALASLPDLVSGSGTVRSPTKRKG